MTANELLTNEQVNNILSITGTDRNDLLDKVAEYLNTGLVDSTVLVRTSKKVELKGYQLDLTTKKSKGMQVIKGLTVQNLKNYIDIKMYFA